MVQEWRVIFDDVITTSKSILKVANETSIPVPMCAHWGPFGFPGAPRGTRQGVTGECSRISEGGPRCPERGSQGSCLAERLRWPSLASGLHGNGRVDHFSGGGRCRNGASDHFFGSGPGRQNSATIFPSFYHQKNDGKMMKRWWKNKIFFKIFLNIYKNEFQLSF